MFERSCYDKLQDYLQSDCKIDLTAEETEYYNALYVVIGINRKYGKEAAIVFLMKQYKIDRRKSRQLYSESINLFYVEDKVERKAWRNLLFDDLYRAAKTVQLTARSAKDMEIYSNILKQAYLVKQLDKEDEEKKEIPREKPINIFSLNPETIGLSKIDRHELAAQIDSIADLKMKEKQRIKRDAGVEDIEFEELYDDQEDKTKDIE